MSGKDIWIAHVKMEGPLSGKAIWRLYYSKEFEIVAESYEKHLRSVKGKKFDDDYTPVIWRKRE